MSTIDLRSNLLLVLLAASTCMLAKHSTKKDDKSVEGEAMAYKAATVSRLWTAYAMELLEDSRCDHFYFFPTGLLLPW